MAENNNNSWEPLRPPTPLVPESAEDYDRQVRQHTANQLELAIRSAPHHSLHSDAGVPLSFDGSSVSQTSGHPRNMSIGSSSTMPSRSTSIGSEIMMSYDPSSQNPFPPALPAAPEGTPLPRADFILANIPPEGLHMHDVARFFTPYVASSRQADFIALLRTVTDWNQESNSVHRKSRFTLEQNLERASYFGETLEIAQPALLLSDTIYSPSDDRPLPSSEFILAQIPQEGLTGEAMLQVFEPFVPKSKSGAFVTLLRSVAVYDETSQTWRRRLDNQTAAQLFDQPTLSLVSVPMSVAATAMAPEMPGVLATAMAHPIPAVWATVSELRASSSSYELNEVNTNLEFPVVQEFMIASPTMMTAPSDLRAASESRAPTQNLNEHDPRQEIKRTHSG